MESNIENFWGVAQILIGVAGPLLVNGERKGSMYPWRRQRTMLASYNRGMKVIRKRWCLTTVSEESMQRLPVFIFETLAKPETSSFGSR